MTISHPIRKLPFGGVANVACVIAMSVRALINKQ